jgi:crotonobetainyl-CoA:carnitine CoA-transferase CaiB-like acyl-CoA transferase
VNAFAAAEDMLAAMWSALGGDAVPSVRFHGDRVLPSCYPMSDLGAAAFAAAGLAIAELSGVREPVEVDRTLCTGWFHRASRPLVPAAPPRSPFHALSRDFPTADGRWLRFQANYPHLRRAVLDVLGAESDGAGVAEIVAAHPADEVEAAVVAGGGAAAATRTVAEWRDHPQGRSVAAEPLVAVEPGPGGGSEWCPVAPERPLAGLRVLDLTRVLAGPLASRFLAACGAQVLRLDAPGYAEPAGYPGDLTLGKRCAVLDLARERDRFLALLADADVLVHGLRPGALDHLGLGRAQRIACRPDLVEVTLNAYGWAGPWRDRRGFDTLVQASCGMALAGGAWAGAGVPHRWPLSILDHAAGYLMAAAAVCGVTRRLRGHGGSLARVSLAGVAHLLEGAGKPGGSELTLPLDGPVDATVHIGASGPARRLVWPLAVEGVVFGWDRPADPYGSATPLWTF